MARERTGRGQRVDVSLLGSQIWAQASEYTFYLSSGELPGKPNRGHPMIPGLYGIMPTADGWIAVVGVTADRKPAFYDAVGRPELATDERFATPLLSKPQKAELFAILAEVFVERTTAEWCEILRAAGQRYAPVRTYAEVADDPQVWENGYLTEADGARVVGTPIRLSDTRLAWEGRRRTSGPTRSRCSSGPATPTTSSPTCSPPAPSDAPLGALRGAPRLVAWTSSTPRPHTQPETAATVTPSATTGSSTST
jgi:crotonobetainyl-CoA:carnitine CoA-transferase CaiB-like acyl-CoA transferase